MPDLFDHRMVRVCSCVLGRLDTAVATLDQIEDTTRAATAALDHDDACGSVRLLREAAGLRDELEHQVRLAALTAHND